MTGGVPPVPLVRVSTATFAVAGTVSPGRRAGIQSTVASTRIAVRPWPAGIRSARLTDFPEAVTFVNPPADEDAADRLMERLEDDDWAVIDGAEWASLRPLKDGVDQPDVVVWLDGEGAATGVGFIAGIAFRSVYLEGTTRADVTPDLLRELEAANALAAGGSPC